MDGQEIKSIISEITASPEQSGFEVYVITKTEPQLKKMGILEIEKNNLRLRLKNSILSILNNKYNAADADYVSADRIADEQQKFYIIETSQDYNPFSILESWELAENFCKENVVDATGIAFLIKTGENQVWAYQHLWPIMVPNKSRRNLVARIISGQEGDVFEELDDPIIAIAEKIDLLIINDCIITSDFKLLQNSFGFQEYINIRAERAICSVEDSGVVLNVDKLRDYVKRGKPKYAKKMMRIAKSKVLSMEPKRLWERIHNSTRWNGKIKEENNQFVLGSYSDVENLIDLLDERYTRSDITDTEYDTDVKQAIDQVEI